MDNENKVIQYSSLILVIITITTFIFALRAVPISGAFSPTDPIQYPYLETKSQFPNDYIWMYIAIFMLISYLIYMISIEVLYKEKNPILVKSSVIFAKFSVLILITTYFLQAEVLPINIILEQYNGISLFTQYNPYGMFIASEVLGYFFMMISMVLIAPIFKKTRSMKFIRIFIILSFISTVIIYILLSSIFGLYKMERFEVFIICITWIDLILIGIISFINNRKKKVQ